MKTIKRIIRSLPGVIGVQSLLLGLYLLLRAALYPTAIIPFDVTAVDFLKYSGSNDRGLIAIQQVYAAATHQALIAIGVLVFSAICFVVYLGSNFAKNSDPG